MREKPRRGARAKVLQAAEELAVEVGPANLSLDAVAARAGVAKGGLLYHFPTKAHLVAAIGAGFRAEDEASFRLPKDPSLQALCALVREGFRVHHRYRCLFLSLPKLIGPGGPLASLALPSREAERRVALRGYLERLVEAGLLRPELTASELDRIVSLCGLLPRGWVSDARVSFPDRPEESRMDHYLHLLVDHLSGAATPEGRRGLEDFRKRLGEG